MSQISRADFVRGGIRRGEQLSLDSTINNSGDVLEYIALCENIAARSNLEGMAGGIIPVIVDLEWWLARYASGEV